MRKSKIERNTFETKIKVVTEIHKLMIITVRKILGSHLGNVFMRLWEI